LVLTVESGRLPVLATCPFKRRQLLLTDTGEEIIDVMTARLGVYRMLARLWAEEVDDALWQGLQTTVFPALPETPQLESAYRRLENYIHEAKPDTLRCLAADYAMLCRGSNPVKGADPYESVHRNPLHLMMQDEWEEVFRFYRESGFQRSASAHEPEDHLGIELEFMAHQCNRYIQAYEKGDEAACRESIDRQVLMLETHLLLWVPLFVQEVLKVAMTEFYQSVAIITREFLSMDADCLRTLPHPRR
jgi:TorA maturation chaperone TorD